MEYVNCALWYSKIPCADAAVAAFFADGHLHAEMRTLPGVATPRFGSVTQSWAEAAPAKPGPAGRRCGDVHERRRGRDDTHRNPGRCDSLKAVQMHAERVQITALMTSPWVQAAPQHVVAVLTPAAGRSRTAATARVCTCAKPTAGNTAALGWA